MNELEVFNNLRDILIGELSNDHLHRMAYATDASVYRQLPTGAVYPINETDLISIVKWSAISNIPLIPRAGGTSLAGQVVGEGLVVDVSRHMTNILDIDKKDRWVKVQPGVILSQLNAYLKPHGLRFGPNTSTADRCTIGGMVGNNSSGTESIKYGTTRDHVLHIRTVLSDGSVADFYNLKTHSFSKKCEGQQLENKIYRQLKTLLSPLVVRQEIRGRYPHPSIHRRNTGYALDSLIETDPFEKNNEPINLSKLLCGSEGTLGLFSEITLGLSPLPPPIRLIYVPHFSNLYDALKAVKLAMEFEPYACELVDKKIIECARSHPQYAKLSLFIKGLPEAVLMIELRVENDELLEPLKKKIHEQFNPINSLYESVFVHESQCDEAWKMRSAGLGLLANLPGHRKGVACVEDTAVRVADLPNYIRDFNSLLHNYHQESVYYAHAGAGELHLRPILDLSDKQDKNVFRKISHDTALLVKKYRGSLSGEHGDGRVRSEFIPIMYGEVIMELFDSIKNTWDPKLLFNPGKIVHAVKMDAALRPRVTKDQVWVDAAFAFSSTDGLDGMINRCNGSGDCRKLDSGTMCPTYMATLEEKDTTRARANVLREVMLRGSNRYNHPDLDHALDLCIGCKGCLGECPSMVDMAKLKSEYFHQKNKQGSLAKKSKYYGTIDLHYAKAYSFGKLSWKLATLPKVEKIARARMDIHPDRTLPRLAFPTFYQWWLDIGKKSNPLSNKEEVIIFCDEYTNYFEPQIGQAAVLLLQKLNYFVVIPKVKSSARAAISKGLLDVANKKAYQLIKILSHPSLKNRPIIGLEPSAILGFRDEYPELLRGVWQERALEIKGRVQLFEEFIFAEFQAGKIKSDDFTKNKTDIHVHTHCHQKALSDEKYVNLSLSIPKNFEIHSIPSGCCGMAGSFGYEKEHYDLSQKIGNLVLYPYLKSINPTDIIVATGTSCRHQIKDALDGLKTYHTAEVLNKALIY